MESETRKKISFGIGAVGKDMVYALVSGFILYYYNTVLGISGTFTGIMMMAARAFDAFNDPFMGVVVEKTKTRFGKFRPWIFTGTLTNALILYGMFSIPKSLSGSRLLIYASFFYVLWGVTYTMMDIPFWSMIPAITKAGKDRENLSVIGRGASTVGFAIPTVLTMLLVNRIAGGERVAFSYIALGIGLIFIVTELICVWGVKETNAKEKVSTSTIREMFAALFANDQAMVVVVSIILFNSSLYLTTQLALYFFKFDIGNSDLYSLFGTVGGAGQFLSMLSLPLLRKKWGSKEILTGAISTTIAGYLLLFAFASMQVKAILPLALTAFIIYLGFGLATVLTTVFLADTVDYGEYKFGQRNESLIFSMQTFVVKLASALSVLLAGIGIDLIGLDVKAVSQRASSLMGLRMLMTLLPILGLVVSILFFRKRYKLSEEENKKISEALRKDQK